MTPHQEEKQFNLKMGKGPEQIFLPGRHTEGPESYETVLSISSHQRNANYNEVPLHTSQNGHHKQTNKQQVLTRL